MKKRTTIATMLTPLIFAFLVPAQSAGAVHGAICDQVIAASNANAKTVTLNENGVTYEIADKGGSGNQAIVGTSGSDEIYGGSGNDVICGLGGGDTLVGGSGHDILVGDLGATGDVIVAGNDVLVGGSGNDSLYGDNGDDVLDGGSGADFLSGAADTDICDGGSGVTTFDSPVTCETIA